MLQAPNVVAGDTVLFEDGGEVGLGDVVREGAVAEDAGGVAGGGEFFAPQMFFFRPAPGWSQYRTPIDGYYQCGSGTHPGGCVMGAPGKLAAGQILKDRAKATRS